MRYNEGDIEKHLKRITSRWDELREEAFFEIRCIKEGGLTAYKKFTRDQMDEAVAYATQKNSERFNVYSTVNPISTRSNGRASTDEYALGSFYCFCDCDTPESVDNYNELRKEGFKASFAVYTGMKPKRGHLYFELDKLTRDMEEWSSIQRAIANKLDSDPVVHNPSRILRVAGTVSYPDAKKRSRGRVEEVTEFRNYRIDKKSIKELKKVFPSKTESIFRINLDDMTQRDRLDIEDALRKIRAGDNWHDNMIRVVASLVAKGRSDQEIHSILSDITLQGYTLSDTIKEVDKAIEGARSKGFTGVDRTAIIKDAFNDTQTAEMSEMLQFWRIRDPITVPTRQWLYGNHYIKDYYTLTVAPGGVGKSTLVLTEVLAMCTGKPLLGVEPIKKIKALYYNAEDPHDEVVRRVLALCQHYDISQDDIKESLMIASGRDVNMILMAGIDGIINEPLIDKLAEIIKENELELMVLDPLANMMTSSESVENFSRLSQTLSYLADRCNIAIEVVHHTRKMSENREASIEDSRGGSSLVAGARSGRVLRNMSEKDATALGVDNHIDYFKIEPAGKNNLSRPLEKVEWYKKLGVQIGNSDWVAVTEKWNVPNAFDGISEHKCQLLWDAIKDESLYLCSHILTKKDDYKMSIQEYMAEFLGMDFDAPVTKRRVKSILRTWLESDVLVEEEMSESKINPKSYRHNKMIKVINIGSVRPGM